MGARITIEEADGYWWLRLGPPGAVGHRWWLVIPYPTLGHAIDGARSLADRVGAQSITIGPPP